MQEGGEKRMRRRWLAVLLAPLLLAAKPCGLIPGGALEGPVASAPADWQIFEGTSPCQLELRFADPHSVNVNCQVVGGRLYVHSYHGARKRWTAMAEADPDVRVLLAGQVYELRAIRITDAEERRRVLAADAGEPSESTWLYRLDPRLGTRPPAVSTDFD